MKFESLEINQCLNKECNQKFTIDNIKLAVWLYGVIFLSEKIVDMKNKTPGAYIGITCPRCLSTTFWHCAKQDPLSFKAELDSELQIMKLEQTDTGQTTVESVCSFEPRLRYYSPFNLDKKALGQRMIFYKGFSSPEGSPYFYSELQDHTATELFDQEKLFCSYLAEDTPPMGSFSNVLWFNENDISELLALENEKHVRIFPRYIYRTELVTKIDHLLAYHYINGKSLDQAIADHKINTTDAIEKLKDYARDNNINFENLAESNGLIEPDVFINQVQKTLERVKIDPLIPAQFLDILTAEPSHLGESWYQRHCDYLWASVNPFQNKSFPEFFVDEIDDPDLLLKIHQTHEEHISMAKRVQENFSKQYTQEFLKDNLVDFLEEYEELIQGNKFSYAHVWKLKESYLEGLYQTVNKGLRDEVPYAMYREGEGWKIVFNGKSLGGLLGKGFLWIYYIISNPENKVYYRALHELSEGNKSPNEEDEEDEAFGEGELEGAIKADQLSVSDASVLVNKNEAEIIDHETYQKAYKKLYLEKKEAEEKGKQAKVVRKADEISIFLKHLDDNNIEYECDGSELKFTSKGTTETKRTTETEDYSGTKYKIINDKIKKNYRDALTKLKGIRKAKELHAHLLKSIHKEDGAFIYKPSEDITWHLD